MARAGLGSGWKCLFANDNSKLKRDCYVETWGDADHFSDLDVNSLKVSNLKGHADLAWASFPCQDLSLAGKAAGIGNAHDDKQTRSGAFWGFLKLMAALGDDSRQPKVIVLENVCGFLSSNRGKDFRVLGNALAGLGYQFGALVIDAVHFLPQSRPRVFVVAVDSRADLSDFAQDGPSEPWHTQALIMATDRLSEGAKKQWVWWRLTPPADQNKPRLEDLISEKPEGVSWHEPVVTKQLIGLMSDRNLAKLEKMKSAGTRQVGTIYKRTRCGKQCAELRTDGIAGCLRTPGGGSSRQLVLEVNGTNIRSRLISPKEAMTLMGASEHFRLPTRYNDAYHIAGDGVAVPVVRYLSEHLLEPILEAGQKSNIDSEKEAQHLESVL